MAWRRSSSIRTLSATQLNKLQHLCSLCSQGCYWAVFEPCRVYYNAWVDIGPQVLVLLPFFSCEIAIILPGPLPVSLPWNVYGAVCRVPTGLSHLLGLGWQWEREGMHRKEMELEGSGGGASFSTYHLAITWLLLLYISQMHQFSYKHPNLCTLGWLLLDPSQTDWLCSFLISSFSFSILGYQRLSLLNSSTPPLHCVYLSHHHWM